MFGSMVFNKFSRRHFQLDSMHHVLGFVDFIIFTHLGMAGMTVLEELKLEIKT